MLNLININPMLNACGTGHYGCSHATEGRCEKADGHGGSHKCDKCGQTYTSN